MSKKGISGVITTVIMIALVMAASSIVWVTVNNLIGEKLEEAGSCFDVFEKIIINSRFTCYNLSAKEFQFSISVGDIEIDELLVAISGGGQSQSFKLTEAGLTENYLRQYPSGEYGQPIFLPEKNSGKTYVMDVESFSVPSSIQIAPVIGGKQCEVSDSLKDIDRCLTLV